MRQSAPLDRYRKSRRGFRGLCRGEKIGQAERRSTLTTSETKITFLDQIPGLRTFSCCLLPKPPDATATLAWSSLRFKIFDETSRAASLPIQRATSTQLNTRSPRGNRTAPSPLLPRPSVSTHPSLSLSLSRFASSTVRPGFRLSPPAADNAPRLEARHSRGNVLGC